MNTTRLQPSLWDGARLTLEEAIAEAAASLREYGPRYPHWVVAYSGGKDSSAVLALIAHLIATGQVPAPASLRVLYADTGMELPPLHAAAGAMLAASRAQGLLTTVVRPTLDHRFWVYMLGRGVPPPNNGFRWCTEHLKIRPMAASLAAVQAEIGAGRFLLITGMRLGESAARDARIAVSCSRDGGECGQGWFANGAISDPADTLSPILSWRVCHVMDVLQFFGRDWGFPTDLVADVYGDGESKGSRMGCMECTLVSEDRSFHRVIRRPEWAYLAPYTGLENLYEWMRRPAQRLRKDGTERRKDGTLVSNPMRLGPLTLPARREALARVLALQATVNAAAHAQGRPRVDLIDAEEAARVETLIAAGTWPDGWAGTEPTGDVALDQVLAEGVIQPLLGVH